MVIGPGFVTTQPLAEAGEVVVGRDPEATIYLDDASVSRRHARIRVADGLFVEDLGSRNGTLVQDNRLKPGESVPVSVGDVIEIGSAMLVVQRQAGSRPRRLWTHGYFEARLENECARVARDGPSFALLRIRLSGARSDAFSNKILGLFRPTDIVASYAPNEYEALLFDSGARETRNAVEGLKERLRVRGLDVRVGLALCPRDGRVPEALMARACSELDGKREADSEPSGTILESRVMKNLDRLIARVAAGEINVLVLGETGVGKEVVAERIHQMSARAGGTLLKLNCATLSEALLESELFGHEKGAFTGADRAKPGLLETARGGTVFLDEIGDMPPSLQARLLRVMEERKVRRVGGLESRPIDVRFIAATHRDLEAEATLGRFRKDLYYRLNGISLVVPPLRERIDDIEPLARAFIDGACRNRRPIPSISPGALSLLTGYGWPGNIRELRNIMERAVLLCGDSILAEHLPSEKMSDTWFAPPPAPSPPSSGGAQVRRGREQAHDTLDIPPERGNEADLKTDLEALERRRIQEALEQTGGNQTRTAKLLGISRRTLISRMEAYGFPRPRKR